MKAIKKAVAALCLGVVAAFPLAAGAEEISTPGAVEAVQIAVDAYIYGYPLVTFDMVRKQQTNVAVPDGEHAPMGQVIRMRSYPAVDNHCCAAPNADTLYTEAWLDVSKEPSVLSIPDMGDRYYIVPMLDGWSEVFMVASSPTTGGKAQTYAITGPGWSGTLPQGVTQVKAPTGMVWILGRIYCTGTPNEGARSCSDSPKQVRRAYEWKDESSEDVIETLGVASRCGFVSGGLREASQGRN